MADALTAMREVFGFKREPDDLGDGHAAFIAFLLFATGDSEEGRGLQAQYFHETDKAPRHDMRATAAETGEFIDWLIQWHWGEQTPAQVH